jgi:hypothetical protein
VKRSLAIVLDEAELIELLWIMMDDAAESALAFLKRHLKGRTRTLLEGGRKVVVEMPGAGMNVMQTKPRA